MHTDLFGNSDGSKFIYLLYYLFTSLSIGRSISRLEIIRPISHLWFYRAMLSCNFITWKSCSMQPSCCTLRLCRINKKWPISLVRSGSGAASNYSYRGITWYCNSVSQCLHSCHTVLSTFWYRPSLPENNTVVVVIVVGFRAVQRLTV